ncbi:hypothetical protein U6B65_10945 [Oscillospiraceae bacterium MB08-C2-2]|nr:hypothetical protein U6B65_10945 [Oscillospiraceae bacterium MB08-C2-2]
MKNWITLVLSLLLVFSLAACSTSNQAASSSEAESSLEESLPPAVETSLPSQEGSSEADISETFPYPEIEGFNKQEMPGFVSYFYPDNQRTGIVALVLSAEAEKLKSFGSQSNEATDEINAVLRQYIGSMIPQETPPGAFVEVGGKTVYEIRVTMEPAEDNNLEATTSLLAYAIPSAKEQAIVIAMGTAPTETAAPMEAGITHFIEQIQ